MKTWHIVAIVCAILLAGILNGGVYSIVGLTPGENNSTNGFKVNRITGRVWVLWGDHGRQSPLYDEGTR
jgi:hypothetical protein